MTRRYSARLRGTLNKMVFCKKHSLLSITSACFLHCKFFYAVVAHPVSWTRCPRPNERTLFTHTKLTLIWRVLRFSASLRGRTGCCSVDIELYRSTVPWIMHVCCLQGVSAEFGGSRKKQLEQHTSQQSLPDSMPRALRRFYL